MKVAFLPKSRSGRLSVWLSLGTLAAYLLLYLPGTQLNLLPPVIVILTLNAVQVGAFTCAILAIIAVFRRDMAVLLLLPVLVSLGTLYLVISVLVKGAI